MEKPIFDPPVPYIGPIYGGRFSPGKMVRIQGAAPGVAYRFDINLQCGPETAPRDDVAMQVSVRILDGYIILNSLQNGIWGEEQRGMALPIKRAEKFEIILMCDFSHYKVAINGQHYCEFPQRIHYDRISHLAIDGDVSIIQISYESGSGNEMGSSRSGFSRAPQSSAPVSVPPIQNEPDDFELIDTTTTTAPPPGLHPAPPLGFSQPPSYESTLNNNRGGSLNAPVGGAPYPTSAPYPTGAPYPISGASHPTAGAPYPAAGAPYPTTGASYPTKGAPYPAGSITGLGVSPYPLNGAVHTPYPTGVPGVVGSPYPPPGAPGIPPPPPGAPVPLNAATSNFRRVQRNNLQKCCAGWCGVVIVIIIIVAVVIVKTGRHSSDRYTYSSSSYDNNYNNYGNNYNNHYDNNNNYGSYNSHKNW